RCTRTPCPSENGDACHRDTNSSCRPVHRIPLQRAAAARPSARWNAGTRVCRLNNVKNVQEFADRASSTSSDADVECGHSTTETPCLLKRERPRGWCGSCTEIGRDGPCAPGACAGGGSASATIIA